MERLSGTADQLSRTFWDLPFFTKLPSNTAPVDEQIPTTSIFFVGTL